MKQLAALLVLCCCTIPVMGQQQCDSFCQAQLIRELIRQQEEANRIARQQQIQEQNWQAQQYAIQEQQRMDQQWEAQRQRNMQELQQNQQNYRQQVCPYMPAGVPNCR